MKILIFLLAFVSFILILILDGVERYVRAYEETVLPMRDYQIEIDNDSIYIFDENRHVGSAAWGDGQIDSVILKDNY